MTDMNTILRGSDSSSAALAESERRLIQLGERVGLFAHDLNNALTSILTNAQLLGLTLPETMTDEREEAADIEAAARKGTELIRQLADFVREEGHTGGPHTEAPSRTKGS